MPHDGSVTLVCAACNTRYGVPVAEIPEGGRRVKCCRCGHVWFSELAAGGATRLPARSAAPETALRPRPADEKAPEEEAGSPLAGKRIVFTGTLSAMSRAEAKAAAAARGARVLGAVSGNVDVLVAGAAAGSKRTKAEQLGIEILDEEAWMRLISGNPGDGQDRRSG